MLVFQSFWGFADCRIVTGDFKLSGVNTEVTLASFAIHSAGAQIDLTMTADTFYENEENLKFRAYRDTEWTAFLKEPLCTGKGALAKKSFPVTGHFQKQDDGTWKAAMTVDIRKLDETLPAAELRNFYYYFVLDDCSLEQYFHDNTVPKIHYKLVMRNYLPISRNLVHMSADEMAILPIHAFSMLASGLVAFLLILNIVWRLNAKSKQHSVHAAVLWVAGAAVLDVSSGLLELLHLGRYNGNGIGSYFLDALSAHMEACCDSSLTILLLSIAAGWTLPSSVVVFNNSSNANPIQKLMGGLAHPISASMQGPSGMLAGGVFAVHIILAQWGRIYNDDFESYHHLEHFPGKVLMLARVVTGFLFLAAVKQTSSSGKFTTGLTSFYNAFAIVGFFWFQALPVLTLLCNWAVPFYQRKPVVFGLSSTLQSGSLMVLAWLVTTHSTAYHKYSHMTEGRENLSDQLEPTTQSDGSTQAWMLGKKAKIRLD